MGVTVTDQCRTYCQKPFRLKEHLKRFRASCDLCRVELPLTDLKLKKVIANLLEQNLPLEEKRCEWSIVFLVTPGLRGSFLGFPPGEHDGKPNVILYMFPIRPERFRKWFQDGVKIRVSNIAQPHWKTYDSRAKHRSRMHWWLAEQQVKTVDKDAIALIENMNGWITETSFANFMLVKNGIIHLPYEDVLNGMTRNIVEELCGKERLKIKTTNLKLTDLFQADEAFLTSTPCGIVPVSSINHKRFPGPGPVTHRLQLAFNRIVKMDNIAFFLGQE